jgi:hypothetical protein
MTGGEPARAVKAVARQSAPSRAARMREVGRWFIGGFMVGSSVDWVG